MKGISVWLFSKIVMLIFLVLIFGVVISLINMVDERAYTDSASVITMNIKDAIQGVITTKTLAGQRVVPLPEKIPEDIGEERAKEYTLVLSRQGETISVALAWGIFTDIDDIKAYVTASLLYVDRSLDISPSRLVINSREHRFFVVNKTTERGYLEVYVGGCGEEGLTVCT